MTVKRIVVIGAGTMGHGIAYAALLGAYPTTLHDPFPEAMARAGERIEALLNEIQERGKLTGEAAERSRDALSLVEDLDRGVEGADLVIEAIPEVLREKLELFGRLDALLPASTILASNTSSLSITEMAAVTERADRFCGMHFFNPVHKMKLVEIVRGLETSQSTVDEVKEVAERMGKETVTIKESPGFITSRINAVIGNEAFYMLEDGVASAEEIDKAVRLGLNHPMGPFEMADLVGLDTRLAVLEFLQQRLGEKYRPAPLLVQYVQAGRLGRKVGKGVYEYTPDGTRKA